MTQLRYDTASSMIDGQVYARSAPYRDATDYIEYVSRVGARVALDECLEAIQRSQLNAFVEVFGEEARARADYLDSLEVGQRGRLHGLVVAVKDEIPVRGHVTGYGTRANHQVAQSSAHVVQCLEHEGAIMVGHTRMPEFGAWPVTQSSHAGTTKNPYNPQYSSGGSSGGTAAAVAGGLVPVGLGGDGGGSIRIPSAHCGLVGLKTRHGLISTYPHKSLWGDLGVVGALTLSVRDSALIYDCLTSDDDVLYPISEPRKELRFTSIVRSVSSVCDSHIKAVRDVVEHMQTLGHYYTDGPRSLPVPTPAFLPQFLASLRDECAYIDDISALDKATANTAYMGAWVGKTLEKWARGYAGVLTRKVEKLFDACDVIVTPTVASRPPRVDAFPDTAIGAILASVPYVAFTALWNVTGHPAISIPWGIDDDGMPIGVQLVARDEKTLLSVAEQLLRSSRGK